MDEMFTGPRIGPRLNLDTPSGTGTFRVPPVATMEHLSLGQAIAAVYAAMMHAEHRSAAVGCWHALRPLIEARFRPEEG